MSKSPEELFKPFLDLNPSSSLEYRSIDGGDFVEITEPWGDVSFSLIAPKESCDALANALSGVRLPNSLSAVIHESTESLEIIWTAYELDKSSKEIIGRNFAFEHEGRNISCRFDRSSDELLEIARHFRSKGISQTAHRNLQSFNFYTLLDEPQRRILRVKDPYSFWISPIPANGETLLKLLKNLNFFLTYYDRSSPTILIHEELPDEPVSVRYVEEVFPEKIFGSALDENMVNFWTNSFRSTSAILKFIIYYRIIEYASYSHGRADFQSKLKLILNRPSHFSNTDRTLADILSLVNSESDFGEVQRFEAVLRECVSPKILWKVIEKNKPSFSNKIVFDGGFELSPLTSNSDCYGNFETNGVNQVSRHIRSIRNVLSHGKDFKSQGVILPSRKNTGLLKPWVSLIETAAAEVILHSGISS